MIYMRFIRPILGIVACIAILIGFFLPYFVVSGPDGETARTMVDVLFGTTENNLVRGLWDLVGFAVLVLLPIVSFVMMLLGRANKNLRRSALRLVGFILVVGLIYTLIVVQFASQIAAIGSGDITETAGPGLWLVFGGLLVVFVCNIGAAADVEITKVGDDKKE